MNNDQTYLTVDHCIFEVITVGHRSALTLTLTLTLTLNLILTPILNLTLTLTLVVIGVGWNDSNDSVRRDVNLTRIVG